MGEHAGQLASRKAELEELSEELANARIAAIEAEKKLDDAREEADAQRELRVSAEKARDEALEGKGWPRRRTARKYKRTLILKKCSRRINETSASCYRVEHCSRLMSERRLKTWAYRRGARQWRLALDDTVTKCKATASSLRDERKPALTRPSRPSKRL